jgi:hypothetical protein
MAHVDVCNLVLLFNAVAKNDRVVKLLPEYVLKQYPFIYAKTNAVPLLSVFVTKRVWREFYYFYCSND